MIRIAQIKAESARDIPDALCAKLKLPRKDLLSWSIHRKSVDARGQRVTCSWIVDANVKNEKKYLRYRDVKPTPDERFVFEPKGTHPLENRPVVAGFGPAGMFAGLLLARYGYKPLILERGSQIDKRKEKVDRFWKEGMLDPESNVQFGMGGAGAFSDGKLTTRSKDLKNRKVYEELVHFGANEEILIDQHPHIGTDGFVPILKNMKREMEELGAKFLFDTKLEGIETEEGRLKAITIQQDGKSETIPCQAMIVSIGHSALDTVKILNSQGVVMEPKPFAIGVRIEHPQTLINQAMLKDQAENPKLIPARYQLSHTAANGRGVYSFCMCPGGYVIPSSSDEGTVVVNGMSYAARAGKNANAALLVQVKEGDFGPDLFDGARFASNIEKKAYELSGSYKSPVQRTRDYLTDTISSDADIEAAHPTYALGAISADLNELFPKEINDALKEGITAFEKRIPGFVEQGVMSGVETRSSSTIRMNRDENGLSSIQGLYPAGEGAGYAGGIMTSAVDGLKAAMHVMDYYEKPSQTEGKEEGPDGK